MESQENTMTCENEQPADAKHDDRIDLSILYVEDEDIPRERLAIILQRRVRDVRLARDGQEGLDAYRTARPDLVVTDIRMPRMSGLDMIREIKQVDPEARFVVTSAYSDSELLLKAIDCVIDGYILKPVDTNRLFAVIARCAETIDLRRNLLQRNQEQQQLIMDLQKAVQEIKTLQGILPICSSCKKIREDEGYWTQVETYITRHTDVMFSHSICPDCAKRLYPDIFDKMYGKDTGPS